MATRKKAAAKPAKAADNSASTLVVRSRDNLKSPPGTLGYSHLVIPDEAFGKSQLKASVHFDAKAFGALAERVNEAYWALIPELLDQADEKKIKRDKVKILSKNDLIASLVEKQKDANDSAPVQLPFFTFSCNASYHDKKKGQDVAVTVKAWDAHGAPLDLSAAKVGKGSVIQVLFSVGVWAGSSPFSKWVALPTLRFVGIQILKLKQWEGNGGKTAVGEVTDSDLAFLDDNFSAEDLSLFVKKPESGRAKEHQEAPADNMDDEIPF